MPGVIMADAAQNGVRTNHDRDQMDVSVNGASDSTSGLDKGKGKSDAAATTDESVSNLLAKLTPNTDPSRMNDLPNEIVHITQGFVPVSLLLTRLSQRTHNALQEKITELAKLPIPASAVNGSSNHTSQAPDDVTTENLRKKATLLHFAQDMHAKWIKALVITEWSRKSPMVSKLIDLKYHIDQQRVLYDASLDGMVNIKRDLTYARMPSPDLKTALQVLSTGSAPWIPDLQYIEPPPLTPTDQLKWINELNTLLSLRLNLEDYDKIPPQFRDYDIGSGRVTFKVRGEFEVELTIADEDFEKQFWFIDFRYSFEPAAASVPDSLRTYLESCVNDVLSKDGLQGCYQFLHEFVLTSKIHELKRQATQLSKSSWSGTLGVEALNRGFSVQYWSSRTAVTGLKNWVLIAVDSAKKQSTATSADAASRIVAKWYRDNKEVKDVEIQFDINELSMESIIKDVVGRHIEFILTSIHTKLRETPRFKNREAGMTLNVSKDDPTSCSLTTEVGHNDTVSLLMEPRTGSFALKPQSKFSVQYEHQLNNSSRSAADDGVTSLENVRCAVIEDALNRKGMAMGWQSQKSPVGQEETRSISKLREWTRTVWLRKQGWGDSWYVVVFLSLGGDEWWLVEANRNEPGRAIKFSTKLPLNKGQPDLSDSFWTNLTLFSCGMIAQAVDMRELHKYRIKSRSNEGSSIALSQQVRLPAIEADLSAIFPGMGLGASTKREHGDSNSDQANGNSITTSNALHSPKKAAGPRQAWASNIVTILFKGVQAVSTGSSSDGNEDGTTQLVCVSEALLKVSKPSKFSALKGSVDGNLSYNPKRGEFCLRVQHPVGESVISVLKSRIKSIDRFVNFLEAMEKSKGTIISESVTLKMVSFRYRRQLSTDEEEKDPRREWRVQMDLSADSIGITLEQDNPHLRVIDLMRTLVNGDGGVGALMGWLPISLPALEAIDMIETKWGEAQSKKEGRLEFAMRGLNWMSMHYVKVATTGSKTERHVILELQTKTRRGETWWHVWRSTSGSGSVPDDEFTEALDKIWSSKGSNWMGLATGAAGKPNNGVVEMLLAVDGAIRSVEVSSDDATTTNKKQEPKKSEVVVLE